MPKKSKPIIIKTYLNQAEYGRILDRANQTGLSLSAFCRNVSLGLEVRSTADKEAVLALLQSKGDLGRLGGLLKQHLSEPSAAGIEREELRNLLKSIESTQRTLSAIFNQVAQSLLQGN